MAARTEEVGPLLRGTPPPDVVLCNITAMAEPQALAVIRQLTGALGGIPLIILTAHEEIDVVLEAFRLGVRGYIATSLGLSVALEAIRLVAAGGAFIPAASLSALMERQPHSPAPQVANSDQAEDEAMRVTDELTPRQLAVLGCLREGKANKLIAHELGMCESTVKVHVRNILKKLGATNRTQAAYFTYSRTSP